MKLVTSNSSPNHYNGRKDNKGQVWKADIIVFHQTGGDELAPAIRWYLNANAQCSPNWLIDKDGTIYQLVDPSNAAWCNGTSTSPSDNKYYGYALSEIVRSRKVNANLYSLSAEFVHCARGDITEAQKTAAVELIQNVIIPYMKKNGVTPQIDRKHVIGHSEVTPKTRDPEKFNCPGKLFPFDEIISRVNGKPVQTNTPTTVKGTPVNNIYQAISNAAIRAGASKSDSVYDRVTKYSFYPADTLINNGWFKHAGKNEYSKLEDGGSLFSKVGEYKIMTATTRLNVRKAPTTKSDRIVILNQGDKVYVWNEKPIEAEGYSWRKIIVDNKVAYVAGEYLKG